MSIRFVLGVIVYIFIGWILCPIDQFETYSWYSGIWHGTFFVPNLVKDYFVQPTPFIAETCTAAYTVFYYIFALFSVLLCVGIFTYNPKSTTRRRYR